MLVKNTFTQAFDKARFSEFVINVLNQIDQTRASSWNSQHVKDAFKSHVQRYERLGTYTSPGKEELDILIVHLTSEAKLERARTATRNFVADFLQNRDEKDAALVAFVSPSEKQWRFSYVKMEYAAVEIDGGKVGVEARLTPARRFSYIVGEGESCHTAQCRFVDLLGRTDTNPTLSEIENAFSVEAVTKEFFERYAELFERIQRALERLVQEDKTLSAEFGNKRVNPSDFAQKLMGHVVFLYFLQKKGWLGVAKGDDWGNGPHNFLRRLATGEYGTYRNFFNDVLEPLFYETLASDRGHEAWCDQFKCRIPFLNGGLFEPSGNYDWRTTEIMLPNTLFTNADYVEEGVLGTGVLDIFDRYNFTVNEAEPLEKEVAIDPEMLGTVFENLIEENRRKGLGAYYTPREIVHYMCQESLINYLDAAMNADEEVIPRPDIDTFVRLGEQISHYEAVATQYAVKMPASIERHARKLDELLAEIYVCDPAVGSGAFPVGMMAEIVRARTALTPYFNDVHDRTPYYFKRHTIQNSLYGVDIDTGAVEIAKLRLWLSLVVDEEETKQIKPLPNLEYKIVDGNSLLGFPYKPAQLMEIEGLKDKFFDEWDQQKKSALRQQIDEKLGQCIALSKKSLGYAVSFDFEVWFSEVFRKRGGFDVVIANPPYVDSETMVRSDPESRKLLAEQYDTAKGNWDLYIPFWELALKRVNKSGTAALITPNKWLSIGYGKALRALAASHVYQFADYSRFRAFESVGVFPVVTFMTKARRSVLTIRRFMEDQRLTFAEQLGVDQLTAFDNWGVFLSPSLPLVLKIVSKGTRLSEICDPQEPFTVSEAYELKEYLEEFSTEAGEVLKFVNTGTIDPYVTLWGEKQTTYIKSKYSKPVIARDRLQRDSPRRFVQSTSPKMIISGIRHFECFYDAEGGYVAGKSTVILMNIKKDWSPWLLLGLLNSHLTKFFLKECYGSLAMDGGINFSPANVSEIPVAQPADNIKTEIENAVKEILRAKKSDVRADTDQEERRVDQLVYKAFGLAAEEISAMEESVAHGSSVALSNS
jgi:hypothetical protein